MTTYSEKLLDPRWQRKRLEILQRDNFTCRGCDNDQATLHVHHLAYERDREPWDYPNSALITYCRDCHVAEHETRGASGKRFLHTLRMFGLTEHDFDLLSASFIPVETEHPELPTLRSGIEKGVDSIVETYVKNRNETLHRNG